MTPTVLIIQEHLPGFRVPFYEALRGRLTAHDISLRLVFAPNQKNTFLKAGLSWAEPVPIRWLGPLAWQPVLGMVRGASLVVVQQENKYLVNPLLQLVAKFGGPPVAYWGHGRNFQRPPSNKLGSKVKKLLSRHVHWWFAYNDLSARVVSELGFPNDRITSVGNAVDTTGMIQRRSELKDEEVSALRSSLGTQSQNIAVYTGGLYPNKRIDFLLDAAMKIRQSIPDFELLVIGDGPERTKVTAVASNHPWIHDIGPKSDEAKVPYWAISKVLLMPGLVGLVVVDSFALGVPLVTTDFPFHSPEIDYLKHDINGLILPCGDDVSAYAQGVTELLTDQTRLKALSTGASQSASLHTIERMADRFTEGVVKALGSSR